MQSTNLLRLATRLRISMAALVALGMVGAFTQTARRAMFLLPDQPAAAFVSVGEPAAISYSAGFLADRRGANPASRRRGAQRSIPSTLPTGIITESAPVSVASLAGNPVADALPAAGAGSGLARPEASPLAALRSIPADSRPGAFAGVPGQVGTVDPETPDVPVVVVPTNPTIPTDENPGTPTDNPGPGGTVTPETPPPAVPEPPAWMLALAGLGLLAAFKYGKNFVALKQGPAFA